MCMYQDTETLSKRIFASLGTWEDAPNGKSGNLAKNEQEAHINDVLIKKKKMLGKFPNFSFPLNVS